MMSDMSQVPSESYEDAIAGIREAIDQAERHAAAYALSTYPHTDALNEVATLLRRSLQTNSILVSAIYNNTQVVIGAAPEIQEPRVFPESDGLCVLAVGVGKPVAINDLRGNEVAEHVREAAAWRSWASAPIFINGRAAGSVCALEAKHPRIWTSLDQAMLVRSADQVQDAVNEWLYAA